MRLAWMQQDLAGARRAATLLFVLLAGSVLANIILATLAIRASGRERIVVLPPAVHRSFWVEPERVSREYLEQMGYFLAQLVLDVTPQSTDYQAKVLLQYASPGATGALRATLAATAERLNAKGGALDKLTQGGTALAAGIETFSAATLPKLSEVADETARTMRQLRRTVSAVDDNPQSLIFGNGPRQPGPGEPGFSANGDEK